MPVRNFLRATLSMGVCLTLLGGCSWVKSWDGGHGDQTLTPPPQTRVMETADATWMEPTDKSKAVEHMVPETTQGNKDAMERLARLEKTVTQMQNDMNTMMPVLSRLVAVQTDMQTMLARLPPAGAPAAASAAPPPAAMPPPGPPVTQEPVSIAAPAAAPPPVVTPTPATAPPAALKPPAFMISAVRIGEHPGKTRIVFDVSDKLSFSKDVDNGEHILTIDVQGAGWAGAGTAQPTPKSPLLASWQASPDGQGGTRFVIQLRKPAKILAAEAMAPAAGKPGRIIIDLGPL
jgi:hypothetical protein